MPMFEIRLEMFTFALIFYLMQRSEHRFMMNRLGRRLYHCLMFYSR